MSDTLTRRAPSLTPRTFDRKAGTVTAVISTGGGVQRRDARGSYEERLNTTSGAWTVRAPRLPLLDSHRQGSIGDIIGHAENIRTEAGEIVADITITDSRALALVEAGTAGLSVGYRVSAWGESEGGRVRTATRWEIAEVSLVAVAADPRTHFRSIEMPDNLPPEVTPAPPTATTQPAAPENRAATNAAIRSLGTTLNLGATWADAQIDAGASVESARGAALDAMMQRQQQIPARQIGDSNDDPTVIRTRMAHALAHRLNASISLPDEARQFAGLGLLGMTHGMLSARGEPGLAFLGPEALLTRAVGTGDLPILLTGTGNRVLMAAYQAAPNPLRRLARQVTATDFRTRSAVRFGEFGKLQRVAEHGELQRLGTAELAEAYALDTFGGTFALTRQAIINDDLGAFARITGQMGLAAAETEADLLVKLLTQNGGLGPQMSDGQRLFNAAHGNVSGAGGAIAETTLDAARQAMRGQKGVDGKTPVNATPAFLLVSPARETTAEKLLTAIQAATTSDVNPFGGRLQLLVEPRLSGNRWYLFANPETLAVLEYAYLAGAPGPQMDSRQGWDVLGVEFRVYLDFGCGAVDWRGAYTNAGG